MVVDFAWIVLFSNGLKIHGSSIITEKVNVTNKIINLTNNLSLDNESIEKF